MDINRVFRRAGQDSIQQGAASPEAWALVDKLRACKNDGERARMMDDMMNAIVAEVIRKLTGKEPPPIKKG